MDATKQASVEQRIKEFEEKTEITAAEFFDLIRLYRVLDTNVFNPDLTIEEEQPILWVKSIGEKHEICTPGAMVIVVGKFKSRKTVIINAIASAMLGDSEVLGFSANQKGKNILFFDTEQKKGSFWKTQRRILSDAKVYKNPGNYKGILLREYNHRERIEIINDTIKYEQAHGRKPDIIFIDGLLDLVKDPLDYVENNQMVEMLMKISAQKITLVMVIHLSNTGTIYGHTGSTLGRKVDAAIEVEQKIEGKDDNGRPKVSPDISIVRSKLTRDTMPFPEFEIFQESSGKVKRLDIREELIPFNPVITISGRDAIKSGEDIPFN